MKKTNNAETLISILIWISIISAISFWAIKMLQYDREKSITYDKINEIFLLETNANNLVKKVITKDFKEKEVFYLYKTWSQIIAYSWVTNEYLKYINSDWELVTNTWTYVWNIYSRLFIVDKDTATNQLIKWGIKELIRK